MSWRTTMKIFLNAQACMRNIQQPQPVKPPLNHTDLQGEQTPHSKQTKHKEQDSEET